VAGQHKKLKWVLMGVERRLTKKPLSIPDQPQEKTRGTSGTLWEEDSGLPTTEIIESRMKDFSIVGKR